MKAMLGKRFLSRGFVQQCSGDDVFVSASCCQSRASLLALRL